MKIAFRTSGGRGEYELAGRQGKKSVTDFAGYSFDFQVSPYILVPGKCKLQINGGKPRLRLDDSNATHAYRWISALLLLHKPNRVRVENPAHATSIDYSAGYQISGIRVDVSALNATSQHCKLRPTVLEVHQGDVTDYLSIPERVSRVQAALDNKDKLPDQIATALGTFEAAFLNPVSHKRLEQLRDSVYSAVEATYPDSNHSDVLPTLEALTGEVPHPFVEQVEEQEAADNGEDDQRSEIQIRADYIRAWRMVTERGHKGRKFSKEVLKAYGSRCLITGLQLPKTRANSIPGVDAAHILPWANYDLDKVTNGVCLSKTYHWAFDAGVIRIVYDKAANTYVRLIEEVTRQLLSEDGFDLADFDQNLGPIPVDRLPANKAEWPDATFLEEFNKLLSAAA